MYVTWGVFLLHVPNAPEQGSRTAVNGVILEHCSSERESVPCEWRTTEHCSRCPGRYSICVLSVRSTLVLAAPPRTPTRTHAQTEPITISLSLFTKGVDNKCYPNEHMDNLSVDCRTIYIVAI